MSGIEYIIEDLSNHPLCPHGPTLLFSRVINESGERRKFFACSACRDRSLCSFFLWEDEQDKKYAKEERNKTVKTKLLPHIDHRKAYLELNKIQQLNEKLRAYCKTCNCWILPQNQSHEDHTVLSDISEDKICFPSKFLTPLSNDRKEAQYLFNDKSIITIFNVLQSLKLKNILCIGAPRIHENILNNYPKMTSLLLDLDHRYLNFYGPLQFCWYNLFNHHFFLKESKNVFKDFLKTDNGKYFGIIIDPPFGGRTEPIFQTLKKIEEMYQKLNTTENHIKIFLFFPYFMEPQIMQGPFNFKMVDYKVDYDNHSLFRHGDKGRKFGSPVRMFTNVALSSISLPEEEGYKYCKKCLRWVYSENLHCNHCDSCTSKDGRTYIHCHKCARCVKPTWQHCQKCDRCAQPDHNCGNLIFNQRCFHCGEPGHKKSECPKVNHALLKRKRQVKSQKSRIMKKKV